MLEDASAIPFTVMSYLPSQLPPALKEFSFESERPCRVARFHQRFTEIQSLTATTMAQIQDPNNGYIVHERTVSSGDHSFTAHADGKHTYCFSNEAWSASSKEVSFNVHGIVYVPEAEAPSDPLEKEVRHLSELLAQVKDEQSYIIVRERVHRNTAESTNARVKWWSIFQLGVLVSEGVFQVWWLKRFFEVSFGSGYVVALHSRW